jgi:hypothetical protein
MACLTGMTFFGCTNEEDETATENNQRVEQIKNKILVLADDYGLENIQIDEMELSVKTLAIGLFPDSATWIEGIGSDCRPDCNVRFTGNCDCVVACIESGDLVYFDSADGIADKYLTGIGSMPSDTKSAVSPYYYDILGRQLSTKPEHGMYIFGGKKYVKE